MVPMKHQSSARCLFQVFELNCLCAADVRPSGCIQPHPQRGWPRACVRHVDGHCRTLRHELAPVYLATHCGDSGLFVSIRQCSAMFLTSSTIEAERGCHGTRAARSDRSTSGIHLTNDARSDVEGSPGRATSGNKSRSGGVKPGAIPCLILTLLTQRP